MVTTVALTTEAEIEAEVGANGADAWLDHDNDCERNTTTTAAINRASREVLRYAGEKYNASDLAADDEIRAWATILACFFLSKSRGNHPPDSLVADVEYIREQLKLIKECQIDLQGVPMKATLRPIMSNRTVDRRYQWRTVRVRPDSSGPRSKLREDRVEQISLED